MEILNGQVGKWSSSICLRQASWPCGSCAEVTPENVVKQITKSEIREKRIELETQKTYNTAFQVKTYTLN